MNNLSIVIPFYNGHGSLAKLINSLPVVIPILIIDDQSDEPLTQEKINSTWLPSDGSNIRVIRMEKKGYFAGAVNRGIQESETDVLVLNQDTWFSSLDFMENIESLRREYAFFGERIRGDHPAFGSFGYVHGTCMFIRRDAIREVGLLNEKDYPLWGSTAEYQWRVARNNFNILPIKEIPGFHHERPTTQRFGSGIQDILRKQPEKEKILVRTPPIVSVIVPCFNYGRYVSDCVNSLVGGSTSLGDMPGQTLQSFEVIIVDDASTDDSMEYIKQVTDIKKGIRAYHLEKNVGTARALNFGIEKSVGKYITFLSADDMREPESIEKLVQACEENPHSFAYDDVWIFHTHERIKKWKIEEYDFEKLIWKNQIHAGILYPRQAWIDTGGYPAKMSDGREDWAFNVALGVKGWCGIHVKNFGYLYRREGQNRTETNTTESHRERFLEKVMSLFPDIYKGQRPMACCGKGNSAKRNVGITSTILTRSMAVENHMIGAEGMERIEYLGDQMSFTEHGDKTNAKYSFGKDRKFGWVAKQDVGSRNGNTGLLSKRDTKGKWLYRLANERSEEEIQEPVEGVEVDSELSKKEAREKLVGHGIIPASWDGIVEDNITVNKTGSVGMSRVSGTLTDAKSNGQETKEIEETVVPVLKSDFELDASLNPTDMGVDEIKALVNRKLSRDEWEAIYKIELKNRSRKGAVSFIEELLANWTD